MGFQASVGRQAIIFPPSSTDQGLRSVIIGRSQRSLFSTDSLNKRMSDENDQEFLSSPATLLSHEEVRPQMVGRRGRKPVSRVAAYRRRLRRRRNRRISLVTSLTMVLVAVGLSYKAKHPEFKLQNFIPAKTMNISRLDEFMDRTASSIQQSLTKLSKRSDDTIQKSVESQEEAEVEDEETEEEAIEIENHVVESNGTLTARVEGGDNTEDEHGNTMTGPPNEVPIEQGDIVVATKAEEQQEEKDARPFVCNIPLAYLVHPKCRLLASKDPMFNLNGLVQDMIQ